MNQSHEPVVAISKRELNKRKRLNRILSVADEVFSKRGFYESTTREIAEQAGISIGTLFLYVQDKRELLMMVVNQSMDNLVNNNYFKSSVDKPFLDQMMHALTLRYQFWATHPEIANATLREIYHLRQNAGPEGKKFLKEIDDLSESLSNLLKQIIENGSGNMQTSPEVVVEVCIDIYTAEIYKWLQGQHLDIYAGGVRLRERLALVLRGIGVE